MMANKYDITQCALYKCRSKSKLKKILLLTEEEFKNINDNIIYRSFAIAKKNSIEKRQIIAPEESLKAKQKRVLKLLQKVIRPYWLISGEKGKSYIDNGRLHIDSKFMLAIDIKSFYDNCKREAVYKFFKDKLYTSPDVADILTNITTYEGNIPTGAPTSQLLAFYAYMDMFYNIELIAKKYNCIFTLYVDDMTFSSVEVFDVKCLAREVDIILRKYGHKPKYKKVKYYSKKMNKPITGTIVSSKNQLMIPNKLRKKIHYTYHKIKQLIKNKISKKELVKEINSLSGQIQSAKNIDSNFFVRTNRSIKALSDKF